ncbi:MAG: methyl-accepting chemotaxis protein [Lachnospiraceae bacterium]
MKSSIMTGDQYRKANKAIFPVIVVILGYIILSTGAQFLKSGKPLDVAVQTLTAMVALIVSTGFFIFKKDTKVCATVFLTSAAIVYFVIMLLGKSSMTYAYAFPILMIAITYLNTRYLVAGNLTIIIGNIILTTRLMKADLITQDAILIQGMIVVLMIYTSLVVTKLLIHFNTENIEKIGQATNDQTLIHNKVITISSDLMRHFEDSKNTMESLQASISANYTSIQAIATSTQNSATAIQGQAQMCYTIQESTDEAENKTKQMMAASGRAIQNVEEGSAVVEDLKEQALNVETASKVTADATTQLTTRIDAVKSIAGSILSISSQTNLLALNASIEAARAGEAGKGFAVVADEIRKLSEQTKEATNQITDIISELIKDVQRAVDSIEHSNASVTKQNEMITTTKAKFDIISTEVRDLTDVINGMDLTIKGILNATETIAESVMQLSQDSEDVTISSKEGVKISEEAVQEMAEFVKSLDSIYTLTQELTDSVH